MTCQDELLRHIVAMQLSLKCVSLQRKTFKLFPRWNEYKCKAPLTLNVTFSTGSSTLNKQRSGNDPRTSSPLWLLSIFWGQTVSVFLLVCIWERQGIFANYTHLNYALLSFSFINKDKNCYRSPKIFQWNVCKRDSSVTQILKNYFVFIPWTYCFQHFYKFIALTPKFIIKFKNFKFVPLMSREAQWVRLVII